MKAINLLALALSFMLSSHLHAQCIADAPLIVGPADQYAFQWCNGTSTTNIGLLFASSVSEYQFKRTNGANIVTINPTGTSYIRLGAPDVGNYANFAQNGDLSFVGSADYLVGDNRYVFRNQADQDQGLFYSSGNQRYEFRNSAATPIWQVGANSGDMLVTGGFTLGNTAITTPGTIRWTGTDLEGRIGGSWVSLSAAGVPGPAGPAGPVGPTGPEGPAGPAGPSSLQAAYNGGSSVWTATGVPLQINGPGGVQFGVGADRLKWDAQKGALRSGTSTGDEWSDANTGDWSLASGYNAIASGTHATAHGFQARATGLASFAHGATTLASGAYALASGIETQATGLAATAMGDSSTASGEASTALGFASEASGWASVALGDRAKASGEASFAVGNAAEATGFIATAIGSGARASGAASMALGASAFAQGGISTAIGSGTAAWSYAETALGYYNTYDFDANPNFYIDSNRIFVVGNGTSSFTRSDAMVILKNGKTGFGVSKPSTNFEVGGSGVRTMRVSTTGSSEVRFDLLRSGPGLFDWRMAVLGGDLLFSRSSDDLASTTDILRIGSSLFRPGSDNSMQLGSSINRWSTVFAANGTINTSDARDKTNIQELNYGLEDIRKLRPVSFNWKGDQDHGTKLGLIAQDLQQVLPEVVRDWDYAEDEENGVRKVAAARLGVYYSDIIPVLIRGIQELDQQVQTSDSEALQARVEELEQINADILAENAAIRSQLDAILDRLDNFDGDLQQCCLSHSENNNIPNGTQPTGDQPSLGQNIPNPFDGSTLISYYLPQGTVQAQLVVADRSGVQVANFALNQSGFGQVRLDGNALPAGNYLYSLTVNGQVIETRQMVIVH
jgi:hypothetical protein